jgi:hypothetical protein
MNKEEQTEFKDWLSTLPQYLAVADATSHKVSEKVEEPPQPTSKPSTRFSKILGNRQSKTYSVDRLNEILHK